MKALYLILLILAAGVVLAETDTIILQDGLDGYQGCVFGPGEDRIKIDEKDGPKEIGIRFDIPADRFRTDKPKVFKARLELFYLYEWWTAYRYDVACMDAAEGGEMGSVTQIFGARTDKKVKTRGKTFLSWEIPAALAQRWIDNAETNKGLKLFFAGTELLDKKKDGDKELGFMPAETKLQRYRPKLVIEYEGNLLPVTPTWVTDFGGRKAGGTLMLRWKMPDERKYGFDIQRQTLGDWQEVDYGITGNQYSWPITQAGMTRLRIRARSGDLVASPWRETRQFFCQTAAVSFRLGFVPSTLKIKRDDPLPAISLLQDQIVTGSRRVSGFRPKTMRKQFRHGVLELCRNEEEAVQLVIGHNDRDLKNVKITVSDLKAEGGALIPADRINVRPLGYVRTEPSGIYLTGRDGWFADVLLEIDSFDIPAETVQPVWISFRAEGDTKPGLYSGDITVAAEGVLERTVPFIVKVWDFELPVAQSLPVLMWGGTNIKAYGYEKGSKEAKALELQHEDLLFAHRMVPGWHTRKFDWAKANLPRKADGTFEFTEYDATVERLRKKGMTRFMIGHAPRLGKWGFPKQFSEQWKKDLAEYITAMTAHLKEKGWLDEAIYYSIDEAHSGEWPSCKMIYKMIKGIEPNLTILQTLNEPKGTRELSKFADIINVNVRQYYKARVPELQKEGVDTWWYVCCWPNENPNLFIEYPGIDPRIIGWMTWKYKTTGQVYWQTMAWGKAFKDMGERRHVDTIKSKWNTVSFGSYNGDGNLFYPGPNGKILCSMRLEGYRDGLEDYEYLVLLKKAVDSNKLKGTALARAKEILKIDDKICDKQFGYELTGETLRKVRREIAGILGSL